MSRAFTDWNVDQAVMFPATARDYVPEDHPVHYVRQLVAEELDLSSIFGSYRDGSGAPAFHPAMMTALLLYGYSTGIRSSRRLAHACRERMDFYALTGGERPNFRTINNCQAAVDSGHQVIVAVGVTQKQTDWHMLNPLLAQVKRSCGRQACEVSADAGYCSEENLAMLRKRHIRGYIATGRRKHGSASATNAKKTTGPLRSAMATRLKRGGHRSRYRLRKYTVEPVFGQIKEAQGIRRFLLRGFEKVEREWQIICASHNLRRLTKAMA